MTDSDREVVSDVRGILRAAETALRSIPSARELLGAVRGARGVAERILMTAFAVDRAIGKKSERTEKKGRFVSSLEREQGGEFIPGAPPLQPLVSQRPGRLGLKQEDE